MRRSNVRFFRRARHDILCGAASTANALWNSDAMKRVACQFEAGHAGDKLLDAFDTLSVADMVLRSHRIPTRQMSHHWLAGDGQDRCDLLAGDLGESLIVEL